MGLEPTASRATIWRSSLLSYTHHMARLKRLELLTHCLEGSCSIRLSYRRIRGKRLPAKQGQARPGAGDGNRTHTTSLEGWDSTIELHPRISAAIFDDENYYSKIQLLCQAFHPDKAIGLQGVFHRSLEQPIRLFKASMKNALNSRMGCTAHKCRRVSPPAAFGALTTSSTQYQRKGCRPVR